MKRLLAAASVAACLLASSAVAGPVTAPMQADAFAALKTTTATTKELIPALSGKTTFVTLLLIRSGGAANVNLVSGTGTDCGTGTADIYPAEPLTASDGFNYGSGLGVAIPVAPGLAVCGKSDAAQTVTYKASYSQR